MKKMKRSECAVLHLGLKNYWCDINAYSPGINCTPDGCYYYKRGKNK